MAGLMQDSAAKVKTRFLHSDDIDDLDIIIALYRKGAVLTPQTHSNYPRAMADLAKALEDRYRHLADPADWDHIIAVLQTLIHVRLDPSHLKKLADAFATRYRIHGKKRDLDDSIRSFRKTLNFRPTRSADRINALGLLAQLLALRYHRYHQMKDLNQAIKFQAYAYFYPHDDDDDDDTIRVLNLREYIGLLHTRFRKSKDQAEALQIIALTERIIERGEETVTSTDFRRISEALLGRFGHSWSTEKRDLELAVSYQLQGLNLQDLDDPYRGDDLVNLGCILRCLFLHTENRKYLDEAIGFLREALELFSLDHRERPQVLFYLSRALRENFRQTDQYEFLRESIDLGKAAMESAYVPKKVRPRVLGNLADSLWAQYAITSDATLQDVDVVILLREQVLEEWEDNEPDYLGTASLANALRIRFFKSFDVDDLNRANRLLHAHMTTMSNNHSAVSQMSASFALNFYARFWVTKDPEDLKEGGEIFQQAATHFNAPVWQKFDTARTWAAIADQHDRHGDTSALEAYRTAIELLPRLVSITTDLELRQHTLVTKPTINGLGLYAAGYAIKKDKLQDAIDFMEEGRAVFWNQALKLRTPVADLEHKHPELAEQFRRVSKALEKSAFLGRQNHLGVLSLIDTDPTEYQQDTEKLRDLDSEWDDTLRRIRQKSGFDKFLLPRSTASLQKCPLDGPVVMLCITVRNSGAILITPNETKYIPLDAINHTDVDKLVELMNSVAVPARKRPRLGPRPPSTSSVLSRVLKELWEKIALPIIRFLEIKKSGNPLRVYWCPTGISTFLPIHAAGLYDDLGKASESLSDYIVSSYIPTLETLIKTFEEPAHENVTPHKILAIAQPQSLPYALKELRIIEERLESRPHESLIKLGDEPSNPATISTVLQHLTTASVVHFACHGKQVEGNPLESGLLLEDGRLDLSRIMQMEMKNANLAFLCACETAMGERKIPDESMHLGAALLFAGFKGVIGTMWSIADRDGPKIADEFYGRLFDNQDGRESRSNINEGARALHDAVLKLRSEGVPLQRWVPFVYFGR